jgi:PAS domain S-box-containing protein
MQTNPYKQYFEAMPCYATVQSPELRVIDANQRFRSDFGDWEGRYCYQVYKRRSEKCEQCLVEKTLWDGRPHRHESQVTSLDGREISVLVETTPIRNEAGEITAVVKMSTDITQIKRLETKLRESQERYRLLFEEVPCYISIQDADLNLVEANRPFREDFGDTLGGKCWEIYKHRTEPCYPCPVQRTFDDGGIHMREEVVTSRHGRQMNVLVTTAPIPGDGDHISRVMEMSVNITQIRELEDKLTKLGILISSVSHGLKGLLNGLSGGMYLVDSGLKKGDEARTRKGWEMVQRNVSRIQSMVQDILYYAKDREPNWEVVSPVGIAEEVCGLMHTRAEELGIEVACDLDPNAGEFEVDPQAIRSLLTNLVENALDACRLDQDKTEHNVSLCLRGDGGFVEYVVEDNGIGMDRETQEKAFSLFFSSKGMEGTGLGLFIANKLAEAHGGRIRLESEPGVGTRFTVSLPREGATAPEAVGSGSGIAGEAQLGQ